MSKTSEKLAAGVRKVKAEESAAETPREGHGRSGTTVKKSKDPRPEGEGFVLPAPTHGLHPARIWPD